jgi:pimeloyl-ACP methyl ester carboxylesterase
MFTVRDDVRLSYRLEGPDDGPPLLLLPPLGRAGAAWGAQLPVFTQSFRCIVVDTRGTGRSDQATEYSIPAFAQDALAVVEDLGLDRVHVAGWSMGAATAMEFALRVPERTTTLSLYTPWARADATLLGWFGVLRDLTARGEDLVAGELATTLLLLSPAAIDAFDDLDGAMTATVNAAGYPSREAMLGHLEAAAAHEVLDRLPGVQCPTLVVAGDHDRLVDAALARAVADALPNGELALLEGPDATHGLLVERAAEFNALAAKWLAARA